MRYTRILFLVAVLVLTLVAATAYALPALDERPTVPHPIPGRLNCVGCHGRNSEFAEEHQGLTNEVCTACHRIGDKTGIPALAHPVQGQEKCLTCHAAGQATPFPKDHPFQTDQVCLNCHPEQALGTPAAGATPAVPHALQGREDCLVCHGAGQGRPFPADHQGRTKESCLGCHQVAEPTPAPTPSIDVVPTPIQEPELFAENTCVTCHEGLGGKSTGITDDWKASVHSGQGVGCVSCHGGDPNQSDAAAAMSDAAGFLGVPSKSQIPGLCGSCHSRVDLMRPFDLPTDQLTQYWQSQHGQALLKGDQNVATCFDCHDGHKVLKVKDPGSLVYPTNEPVMCARCHADEALMASYSIPADQYVQYQTSVHGMAVLQKQDLRAPTCSTCHGKHGAAPPGYEQVANVCGQCHAKTEEYYLKGAHRTGMTEENGPRCATCHGQHAIVPATLDLFTGSEEGRCGGCHAQGTEAAKQADAIYQALKGAADARAQAGVLIEQARAARLIVAQQEELFQKANTPLIEAQALQHTAIVADVEEKTDESIGLSQQAEASTQAALKDIDTRRVGMIVALAVILATIVALVLIKRELDRDLEAKRARQGSSSA